MTLAGLLQQGTTTSGRETALRLTPLFAWRAKGCPEQAAEAGGSLIVNPDFEALLFPGEFPYELSYRIGLFSRLVRKDLVWTYRIGKEELQAGRAFGHEIEPLIAAMEKASRQPLPQGVLFTLRDWARQCQAIRSEPVHLLRCDNPEALDLVAELEAIRPLVLARIAPTALALKGIPQDRQLFAELQTHSIYVNWFMSGR